MKNFLKTKLLLIIILFCTIAIQAQSWMSSTSINCEWNDSIKGPTNCATYINPVSISFYDNTFYILDLNNEKVLSYKTHFYSTVEGIVSHILETMDYVILFTVTDDFILCTIVTKQTKRTNLNYYFID